jgi:hypothetical protein
MKPSARTSPVPRRLTASIAWGLLASSAAGADPLKCEAPPPDPRLEELLQADPEDQRINITSDAGELGRAGDATLTGNVRIAASALMQRHRIAA